MNAYKMDKPSKPDVKQEGAEELPLKTSVKTAIQNMTFFDKIKFAKANITVEPVLALFVMPSVLAMLATQNLNLDKACRVNLGFADDICTALRLRKRANHTFEEDEVQKLIASVQAWKSIVHTALPTLLMLFIGAWSDKTGKRKICMLMPIFGEFMTCVLNIINTYFFYVVPVEWTVFMEVIFPALTGGWVTMFLGVFSYLGDITSKETRTFRMGVLNLCMTVGFPIGMGLSGVLLKVIGFYGVFLVSGFLQFINFCYVLFFLDDHTWLENKEKEKKTGLCGFITEFFDFHSLKETLGIAFKKGPNNRRLRICLILTVVCLIFGPMFGELSVMYIFARYRFNWDEVKYSIFSTYSLITHSIGTLFAISVFSRKLKVDDAVLGIISTTSKICGALMLAFARNDLEAYMSPLLEILNGTSAIALRSIASKLVSYQELGKVYSLFGVAETLMPLMFVPLYSRVYITSLHFLPGAIFLVSVLATIPAVGIFGWFFNQHKKDNKEKRLTLPPGVENPPAPAPMPTTPVPVSTLPAPVLTSPAPVPPIAAPVTDSLTPVAKSRAQAQQVADATTTPEQMRPAPIPTSPAPEPTLPAPVPTLHAPVLTLAAPAPTSSPLVPTSPAPVSKSRAPVPTLPVPVPDSLAPVPKLGAPAPTSPAQTSTTTTPEPMRPAPVPTSPTPVSTPSELASVALA